MSKYTLIVVHMQPYWTEGRPFEQEVIANVGREIRRAMKRDCDILRVEIPYYSPLDDEGLKPTHRCLTDLTEGYDRSAMVQTPMFDYFRFHAASNIVRFIKERKFHRERIRVCGVYAGGWVRGKDGNISVSFNMTSKTNEPVHTGCVFDVVLGLSEMLPDSRITVVQDATAGMPNPRAAVNWDDFRSLPNVRLKEPKAVRLLKTA